MTWAYQSERRLLDIERALDGDHELRRDVGRLRRVMAVRQLAGHRGGRCLVGGLAAAVGSLVLLAGLAIGHPGQAGLAALITGGVLAAAVTFALLNAVLDHQASPASDDRD